jgi:para-nitrobenzyl esterase
VINRRVVTQAIAGIGIGAISALGRADAEEKVRDSPIARTTAGDVQGWAESGVLAYLGVPYGASTAAAGRFMPPRRPEHWDGVRSTKSLGPSCPQVPLGMSPFIHSDKTPPPPSPMQKQLASLFPRNVHDPGMSEDCLVLNIWTPALDSVRRPVMVWLHGGGFAVGSGSLPVYNGARLAASGDVVVVTINHRLNAFGFLYLGEVAGDAFAQSGNVGMLDIVAALEWVRDNIAGFGGNAANVTIFGESGGAGKVSVMCAMPVAKGLFHKAIMQSGPCLKIADKARGTAIATQLLKDLNLPVDRVLELQHMDAMQLTAAANAADAKVVPRVLGFGPTGLIPLVDGIALHHHPFDTVAAPESAHVPFLVGSTQDEAVLFVAPFPRWGQLTDAEVIEYLRPIAGTQAQQALDLYRRLHPADSPTYLLVNAVTDFWMRQAANTVAELKAQQAGAPAFVYVLQWQLNNELRTPHGTDVSLVFGTMGESAVAESAPDARLVSDQMSSAWVAFARTGNPNTRKLPHWPSYSVAKRANMLFNARSRVVDDYDQQAREFWEATSGRK